MAIRRKNKDKEALLRRAHLGNLENAEDLLNIARQNGIKTAPLDVKALIQHMGIHIIYSEDMESDQSGCLKKNSTGWVCKVNANHHPTRQRFTLAHELAHYVLHRNKSSEFIDHTYFRSSDNANSMEFEANAFAGQLLMPETDLKFYIKNISSNVDNIATHFEVSSLAVRIRSKQLGLREYA